MKKKTIALFLTTVLCLSLLVVPAGAFQAAGTWVSTSAELDGELYAIEEIWETGIEFTLNNDNETGSMDFQEGDGPFPIGYFIEGDEILLYDDEDGSLYGMIDGEEIWLDMSTEDYDLWVCFERSGGASQTVPSTPGSQTTAPAETTASFTDVKSSDWFYGDVTDVQRYGIINGVGNGRFDPQGTLSLAQAITMAARTHAYLRGQTIENYGSVWYQPYVDFAAQKGICSAGEFGTNYNAACSRLTMALLFARVVPSDTKTVINDIKTLPDVTYSSKTAPVYDLYRYGILTGSDAQGSFKPDKSITRAETAAILNRVLDTGKRKKVELKESNLIPDQLDISKVWDTTTREAKFYPEFEGRMGLSLAFFSNYELYGHYYLDESGYVVPFKGTYSCKGDQLTIKCLWDDAGEGTAVTETYTFSVQISSGTLVLTQTSAKGFLDDHRKGTVLRFTPAQGWISTASELKSHVLDSWGYGPQ